MTDRVRPPAPRDTPSPVAGVVGGGQLARMMQQAAIGLDLELRLLAASGGDSAARVIPGTTVGDERGRDDLLAFAAAVDVLTFDHEHVPQRHLHALEQAGVVLRPSPQALRHAQDKAVMRQDLAAAGLPVPRFAVVDDASDLDRAADGVGGWPVVLKTARGGYDGKGVWLVEGPVAGHEAFRAGVPVVVEERVGFVRELAAVVARSPSGQAVAYPVVESVQQDGICVEVRAPAPGLHPDTAVAAQRLALRVAEALSVVGILAVELFELPDGRLDVNELAMRPHNTGHWTIDGAVTSQFENHLRAVLDLPLGSPSPRAPASVMVNVLGGEDPDVHGALRHVLAHDPAVRVHLYGKNVRPGRKIGHVTVVGPDMDDCVRRARYAADALRGGRG